jgi:hypothetical protein
LAHEEKYLRENECAGDTRDGESTYLCACTGDFFQVPIIGRWDWELLESWRWIFFSNFVKNPRLGAVVDPGLKSTYDEAIYPYRCNVQELSISRRVLSTAID